MLMVVGELEKLRLIQLYSPPGQLYKVHTGISREQGYSNPSGF